MIWNSLLSLPPFYRTQAFNLPAFIPVKEQVNPDPTFPTVREWSLILYHMFWYFIVFLAFYVCGFFFLFFFLCFWNIEFLAFYCGFWHFRLSTPTPRKVQALWWGGYTMNRSLISFISSHMIKVGTLMTASSDPLPQELSMKTAEANGATVILANDPDADRLAVAEHQVCVGNAVPPPPSNELSSPSCSSPLQKDGSWRLFNGNELGCIFGAWMWDNRAKVFPGVPAGTLGSFVTKRIRKNPFRTNVRLLWEWHCKFEMLYSVDFSEKLALISTAVSSKFLKAMADKEGCVFRVCNYCSFVFLFLLEKHWEFIFMLLLIFQDTLTGFKFMGNLADEITRKEDMKVLLAYEEAIGRAHIQVLIVHSLLVSMALIFS